MSAKRHVVLAGFKCGMALVNTAFLCALMVSDKSPAETFRGDMKLLYFMGCIVLWCTWAAMIVADAIAAEEPNRQQKRTVQPKPGEQTP